MTTVRVSLLTFVVLALSCLGSPASGQTVRSTAGEETAPVIASVNDQRVRLVAPGLAAQLRLEIYNELGQKVFDSDFRGGNLLDWNVQDANGNRLLDGNYLCVITVKSLSGHLSQRTGSIRLGGSQISLHAIKQRDMSPLQQQTIGPIENETEITVVNPDDVKAATVVAHDGTAGQISRSTGALSFRLGTSSLARTKSRCG